MYFFGFWQYLKQRRREEIKKYYIEEGIDKILLILDEATFKCYFNYAIAIRIFEYLDKFSEADSKLAQELILNLFSEMQPIITAPGNALSKIQLITGKNYQPIIEWVTEIMIYESKFYHYLKYELFGEIKLFFENVESMKNQKQKIITHLKKIVNSIFTQIVNSAEYIRMHLLNLKIRIDELNIISMKDFDKKIPRDKRIHEILDEIKRDYQKMKIKLNEVN
jgi:hypothetical protein